jgi:hypothetical protein
VEKFEGVTYRAWAGGPPRWGVWPGPYEGQGGLILSRACPVWPVGRAKPQSCQGAWGPCVPVGGAGTQGLDTGGQGARGLGSKMGIILTEGAPVKHCPACQSLPLGDSGALRCPQVTVVPSGGLR